MGRWARCVALIALVASGANALPDEDRHLAMVPWKVLEPGEPVDAPLVLYWVPISGDDLRRSDLLTSDELTSFASRCVAMRVVRFDDGVRLTSLHIEGTLPVVVLASADGKVLGSVGSEDGTISVGEVEQLVRDELDERTAGAEMRLDEASRRLEDGELDAAAELYRSVWEERCVCPRQGKTAGRALKRLGKR